MENTNTMDRVRELRKIQQANGITNTKLSSEVTCILGGIDAILDHYLEENISPLNESQLQQLSELLETNVNNMITKTLMANSRHVIIKKAMAINDLFLNDKDNFLKLLFSKKNADIILSILYHKITSAIMFIGLFFWFFIYLNPSMGPYGYENAYYTIFWCLLLALPYFILFILSCNITAFWLVLRSFEFWVKMAYIIVLQFGWETVLDAKVEILDVLPSDLSTLKRFDYVISGVCGTCIVAWVALFDALNIATYNKILISTLTAMFMTSIWCLTQYYQFAAGDLDYSVVRVGGGLGFSIMGNMASCWAILALFLWKQAFFTYKRRRSGQAILIKNSPYIKWNQKQPAPQNSSALAMASMISSASASSATAKYDKYDEESDSQNHIKTEKYKKDNLKDIDAPKEVKVDVMP